MILRVVPAELVSLRTAVGFSGRGGEHPGDGRSACGGAGPLRVGCRQVWHQDAARDAGSASSYLIAAG